MVVQGTGASLRHIANRLEKAGIASNMNMILHAQVCFMGYRVILGNWRICNHDILI